MTKVNCFLIVSACEIEHLGEENKFSLQESFEGLSVGVGTLPYVSPEQRRSSNYDFKVNLHFSSIIISMLMTQFNNLFFKFISQTFSVLD